eukprot:TRINITY_DN1760_c1_g1_i1.p1 TRINITY_DN1760_c1_g1~~TRINITY_DN1760_c1_g1_i1.p1  ORF type:complete len:181 (+),score=31.34 TRINITY_DN1760_c1_g1_i1:150-692(+)
MNGVTGESFTTSEKNGKPSSQNLMGDDFFGGDNVESEKGAKSGGSKIISSHSEMFQASKFVRLLQAKDYTEATKFLKSLGPSAVDAEIRSLGGLGSQNDVEELGLMLQYLRHEVQSKQNFELIQAYINVFLKAHSTTLMENTNLLKSMDLLLKDQQDSWKILESKFSSILSLIGLFGNLQ